VTFMRTSSRFTYDSLVRSLTLNDLDELVELLGDLFDHGIVAGHNDGHTRNRFVSVTPTVRLSML